MNSTEISVNDKQKDKHNVTGVYKTNLVFPQMNMQDRRKGLSKLGSKTIALNTQFKNQHQPNILLDTNFEINYVDNILNVKYFFLKEDTLK